MLTLPDFREKKIVFVQAEKDIDHQIRFWNSNVRIFKDGEPVDQISCYLVLCIVIIGNTSITSTLIQRTKKYGISILLLNYSLKSYAEINSIAEGNTAIRMTQYLLSESESISQSKKLVWNKVHNQFLILKKMNNVDEDMHKRAVQRIEVAKNFKELLGMEGSYANYYFQSIFLPYDWNRRAPQTREDITNFLMDIGYTYLLNYVDAILRLFGFDTYKGFYHQLFFQRKSLSCDLMEPMRPLIDKQIVKAYNLGIINTRDFVFKKGCYSLKPDSKIRSKYSLMFFECISKEKENIYTYLRQYYLHSMDSTKYQFPQYSI
ncbi:MAG: hypothetical protein US54_C0016G0019 [Candidatus Roizmanbacteria bacterium GW2011_GWA2_37_7]|uniref:CRISPR-associated endonuclease Cas1 n=1 Tax=Candidatus Roizmanbacteria bacterium GW2011_GWA2_37_7 TaxID=1618481 RepID=A0A0G0H4M0_9BACT|nr:MAG: hypothetical protein US54_C0016G0019 [Candidatus Roizmanbacteria bacterium GW2011_GWA2_37_7]